MMGRMGVADAESYVRISAELKVLVDRLCTVRTDWFAVGTHRNHIELAFASDSLHQLFTLKFNRLIGWARLVSNGDPEGGKLPEPKAVADGSKNGITMTPVIFFTPD